jgi:zinc protease
MTDFAQVCNISKMLVVLAFASNCSPLRSPRPPAPSREFNLVFPLAGFELANGAQAFVIPEPSSDLVSLRFRYNVGAIDDPAGQEGIAHLAEHMLFETTVDGERVFDKFNRITVYNNAYTNHDHTDYVSTFEPSRLKEVMELEAARLAGGCATLSEQAFSTEKAVVVQEVIERAETAGQWQMLQRAVLPPNHPYANPVAGTASSVGAITKEQLCAFIDQHYAINNLKIAIGGALTPKQGADALESLSALQQRPMLAHRPVNAHSTWRAGPPIVADIDESALLLSWQLPPDPAELATVIAVSRIVVARINLAGADRGVNAIQLRLGGDRRDVLAIVVSGNKTSHADLYKIAQQGVSNAPVWLDTYGFDNARSRELTAHLASYDNLDDRMEQVLDRGTQAPIQFVAEIKAINKLTRESIQDLIALRFPVSDAFATKLLPRNAGSQTGARVQDIVQTPVMHSVPPPANDSVATADRPMLVPPRSNRLHSIKENILSNGLTVIAVRNSEVPVMHARMVFHSGYAWEPSDKRGAAQLALLLYSPFDREGDLLAYRAGVTSDTDIDDDSTVFSVRGTATDMDYLLATLSRRVVDGVYDPKDITEAMTAWKASTDKESLASAKRLTAQYSAIFGRSHPYATSGIPGLFNLEQLDVDVARQFRDRHFVPKNATLVITGNFDQTLLDRWVIHLFGTWQGGAKPPAIAAARSTAHAFAIVNDSKQVNLRMSFANSRSTASIAARNVIGAMLEESAMSIRFELAASYGMHAKYAHNAAGGSYQVSGNIDASRSSEALQLLQKKIFGLADNSDASKQIFLAARRNALLAAAVDPSSGEAMAEVLTTGQMEGATPAALAALPSEIANLTYADVAKLLSSEVDVNRQVVVLSGPQSAIKSTFAVMGLTPQWLP